MKPGEDFTHREREVFEFAVRYFIENHQLPRLMEHVPSLKYGDESYNQHSMRRLKEKGYFKQNVNTKYMFTELGLQAAEEICGLERPRINPSLRRTNKVRAA